MFTELKRLFLLFSFLTLVFLPSYVAAAELDQNYVTVFGWGKIVASDNGLPQKATYIPGQIDYRDDKFYFKQKTMDLRILNKNGQTYEQLLLETKNKNSARFNNVLTDNIIYLTVWVSHDNNEKLSQSWPQKSSDLPQWKPYGEIQQTLEGDFLTFNSVGYAWHEDILSQIPQLSSWLEKAKPGYMMYLVIRVGFKREAVESRAWNTEQQRWNTPLEFIRSEPIAVGTIIIK